MRFSSDNRRGRAHQTSTGIFSAKLKGWNSRLSHVHVVIVYLSDFVGDLLDFGARVCLRFFENILIDTSKKTNVQAWRRTKTKYKYHFQAVRFFVQSIDAFPCRVENQLLTKVKILLQLCQCCRFVLIELRDKSTR